MFPLVVWNPVLKTTALTSFTSPLVDMISVPANIVCYLCLSLLYTSLNIFYSGVVLVYGNDSPVKMDSSTTQLPSINIQSQLIVAFLLLLSTLFLFYNESINFLNMKMGI